MLRLFIRWEMKRGKSGWGADAGGLAAGVCWIWHFLGGGFGCGFWHILKPYLLTHSEVSTSV